MASYGAEANVLKVSGVCQDGQGVLGLLNYNIETNMMVTRLCKGQNILNISIIILINLFDINFVFDSKYDLLSTTYKNLS